MAENTDDVFVDKESDRRMEYHKYRVLPAVRGETGKWVPAIRRQSRAKSPPRARSSKKQAYAVLYRSVTWKRLREQVLAENQVCVMCNDAIATQVDHIIPHHGYRPLFEDRANLQAVCSPCHSKKSAKGL